MNKSEIEAFKSECNPFRPSIDEGTKEEQHAWNMGVDALFHYIQRQSDGIDENRLDRIIMRSLKERVKSMKVYEELSDTDIEDLVGEVIDNHFEK